MADRSAAIRTATLAAHAAAFLALSAVFLRAPEIAAVWLVVGALIGAASAGSVPGRPIPLYVTFGVVTGLAFFICVNAIRMGVYFNLVVALVLVIGAGWLLHDPGWPPFVFNAVSILVALGLTAVNYQNRYENELFDPETVARAAAVHFGFLPAALVESAAGFAAYRLGKSRKKRKASRAIRTPTAPTDL